MYCTANKYHPHHPLGSPPLSLTLRMFIVRVLVIVCPPPLCPNLENEHSCLFSGFWPLSIRHHHAPNEPSCPFWLPLPSQPQKRAIVLFFRVLAVIYPPPLPSQLQKWARLLVFGVLAIIYLPPLPSQFWNRAFTLIFGLCSCLRHSKHEKCGLFGRVFCVWTFLLPLHLTPTQTQ